MITKQWQALNKEPLAPFYVIVGQEGYLRDETVKRIQARVDPEEWFVLDLEQQSIEDVMLETDTIPFFAEKKAIIVHNPQFLRAAVKDKEKEKKDIFPQKQFLNWLDHPSETAVVVFVAPYEKLDDRKKVVKELRKSAVVIEANPLSESDQKSWVLSQFRAHGKAPTDELIDWVAAVPLSLSFKRNEIAKAALYVSDSEEVTFDDYQQVASPVLEDNVFALTEAFLQSNREKAVTLYNELLKQKEEPLKLVALLAGQLRLLIQVGYFKKMGYPNTQIAGQVKAHPYRVKLMMEHPLVEQEELLVEKLKLLAEVDMQLKSSHMKKERILELYLLAN
ncbi:DNA polymerase-3 subunit delta [Chryseomicrobium aureum]|uniref:DNA polymerase III subunit delta n=1 Tax=Chryseomicrobium aureum TaxID=1441723 RepID=UPI00195B2B7C|nr:DNA polymerase III subunit delta [Chryseomicrobium aureum]MBM7706599.1 DNA polymerase-3 subunit delta [Chryseomicrobium aureum]